MPLACVCVQLSPESLHHCDVWRILNHSTHQLLHRLELVDETERYNLVYGEHDVPKSCGQHLLIAVHHHHLGSDVLSSLGLSMAAYLSFYPLVLLCPFTLLSYKVCACTLQHTRYKHTKKCTCCLACTVSVCFWAEISKALLFSCLQQSKSLAGVVKFLSCVLLWSTLLLFTSRQLTGSWDFLQAVYGVM